MSQSHFTSNSLMKMSANFIAPFCPTPPTEQAQQSGPKPQSLSDFYKEEEKQSQKHTSDIIERVYRKDEAVKENVE